MISLPKGVQMPPRIKDTRETSRTFLEKELALAPQLVDRLLRKDQNPKKS